jgi:hypothetical protein
MILLEFQNRIIMEALSYRLEQVESDKVKYVVSAQQVDCTDALVLDRCH